MLYWVHVLKRKEVNFIHNFFKEPVYIFTGISMTGTCYFFSRIYPDFIKIKYNFNKETNIDITIFLILLVTSIMLFIKSLQHYNDQKKSNIDTLEKQLKEAENQLITKNQEIMALNKEIKQKSDNVNGLIENLSNVKHERNEALLGIQILESKIATYILILDSISPELRQKIVIEKHNKLLDITSAIENPESKGLTNNDK